MVSLLADTEQYMYTWLNSFEIRCLIVQCFAHNWLHWFVKSIVRVEDFLHTAMIAYEVTLSNVHVCTLDVTVLKHIVRTKDFCIYSDGMLLSWAMSMYTQMCGFATKHLTLQNFAHNSLQTQI